MTRWYRERKREHFYKAAKKEGYHSRAAYKLKQIQSRFHIIRKGDVVVDLGAAPGGWSQVAKELVGKKGLLIAVDIQPIKPIDGIVFIKGDMTKNETIEKIKNKINGRKINVVISDMSPNISGNYSMDHANSIWLSENALGFAKKFLKNSGNFVCKVFDGELLRDFLEKVKDCFEIVKLHSPPASRKSSSEIYIVAKKFKKQEEVAVEE
ncbi:MAG: RlmE family RNA methyltransferase [Thermoplasmata archaeon]|nr:MAG: RlmE family RNA methyltransferase [Thermoplasmata archaeon]RLF62821.1 MAG: 23S rRNA (uridine(2552)-2'-O)-methyltransferase [Thermoplasmata archaeon]